MAETNLAFSKIVSTPTSASWSQAYNAGSLFAVISLQKQNQEDQQELNQVGKDVISTFESEFFTIETKDLDSIKNALSITFSRLPSDISFSFAVCFLTENVLYLFGGNGGKAILKRGDKVGSVMEATDTRDEIKSMSGYVQENDIIILETSPFQRIISSSTLASSLDQAEPVTISEDLAPHVHERQEGGAAAIILKYQKSALSESMMIPPLEKTEEEQIVGSASEIPSEPEPAPEMPEVTEALDEETLDTPEQIPNPDENIQIIGASEPDPLPPLQTDYSPRRSRIPQGFSLPKIGLPKNLIGQRRLILTIAIVLVILIGVTSVFAVVNRSSNSNKTLFAGVFKEAQAKYDEGQSLKDLNPDLAKESFTSAKEILEANKTKFKAGSEEEKQISSLLSKVNSEISGGTSSSNQVEATEVSASKSPVLSYEINNSGASYFAQNEDMVFFLDGSGVSSIDKGNDKKAKLFKKSWGTDGGIGSFGSNIYVLDKKDGVLKFVPSGSTYSSTDYFTGTAPDLTSSTAMTIDGSIYILFEDGSIQKYTRGAKDSFTVTGLDEKMSNPTRIVTSADLDNLYILDQANSRIVVIGKDGKFVAAYSADVLKNAKDFEVSETDNTIFALSGGKVYQISTK